MRTAIETRLDEAEKRAAHVETELERERRRRIDVETQLAYANVRLVEFERAEAALIRTVERAEAAARSAKEREAAAKEATVDTRRDAQAAREEAEAARRTIVIRNKTIAALRKNAPPKRRKLLADLQPRQKRARIAAATTHVAEELGDGYALTLAAQRLSAAEANAIRRVQRLTEATYDVIAKLAHWPSLSAVRAYEDDLIASCGGILMSIIDDRFECQLLEHPRLALARYIAYKRRVEWRGVLPALIELVVVVDKGDTVTKLGVYAATDVKMPQSPTNVLLLAAYRGPETRDLLEIAGREAFDSLNGIIADGGARLDLEGIYTWVPIRVLLAADFMAIAKVVSVKMTKIAKFRHSC